MNLRSAEHPVEADPIAFYRQIFDGRTPDELSTIARVKRFREWYIADKAFREALKEHPESAAAAFRARGLTIAPEAVQPLWDSSLGDECKSHDRLAAWPAAKAWKDWIRDVLTHRDMLLEHGGTAGTNPRFDAWRRRQIARSASELGKRHQSITYPIVAYELSKGCSVGCWFCAISAEDFRTHCPYTPENAALWRGILQVMVDIFGEATQTGFCYWATDPMDNPDYAKFIEEHFEITGWLPQTTTAAPLKKPALTAEVMTLFDRHRCVTNRFSITTLRLLRQVHEAFSPEELLGVELVMHTKGSLLSKAVAGRIYERRARVRKEGRADPLTDDLQGMGTIACVSGFLVNMVERTVRLVAPCAASERWPLGYRVYAEATFNDALEYRSHIEQMIDAHMPASFRGCDAVAFREDLSYAADDNGFVVKNERTTHRISGQRFMRELGELIAPGDQQAGAVCAKLVEGDHDVFVVNAAMQDLFDMGLIEPPWPRLAKNTQPTAALAS